MKITALACALLLSTVCTFAQKTITGPLTYGPVPYRTLEQTIGEDYVVLPIEDAFKKHGFDALQKEGEPEYPKLKDTSLYGKHLKLISLMKKEMRIFKRQTILNLAVKKYLEPIQV